MNLGPPVQKEGPQVQDRFSFIPRGFSEVFGLSVRRWVVLRPLVRPSASLLRGCELHVADVRESASLDCARRALVVLVADPGAVVGHANEGEASARRVLVLVLATAFAITFVARRARGARRRWRKWDAVVRVHWPDPLRQALVF